MKIGRSVRRRLRRFEGPVSDLYRRQFIDLDACARMLSGLVRARWILEVGCGDGQMASRLLASFPGAWYTGIDVAPEVGHLFAGDRSRATFHSIDSRTYLGETAEPFDLVVVVDVLHHVPLDARGALLDDVHELTAPRGQYVLKDWIRSGSIAHLAAWSSDRLITGDHVVYFDNEELGSLVPARFPDDRLVRAVRVPPTRNNLLFVYERAP
jgi:2-polyprenyl-6-hydroxyphenyl methylase/3-demethylubiquinone-9 3-methyltransferase